MSRINAGTLAELFETFPNAPVNVNGFSDIYVKFETNPDGEPEFYLKAKTAEPETQGGQN